MDKSLQDKMDMFWDTDLPPLNPNLRIVDSVDGMPLENILRSKGSLSLVSCVDGMPTANILGKTVRELSYNHDLNFFSRVYFRVRDYFQK